MQSLKQKVVNVNRDLFSLEEDLLFPSSTQVNVFVSMDAGPYFKLDGVTLKINDKPISTHLYTKHEVGALQRGAVQRLYTGNIPTGEHELVADRGAAKTGGDEPVRILDQITQAIPAEAWLSGIEEKGGIMKLEGVALDNQTISKFMDRLEQTELLSGVELNYSKQKEEQGAEVMEFTLAAKIDDPIVVAPEAAAKVPAKKPAAKPDSAATSGSESSQTEK